MHANATQAVDIPSCVTNYEVPDPKSNHAALLITNDRSTERGKRWWECVGLSSVLWDLVCAVPRFPFGASFPFLFAVHREHWFRQPPASHRAGQDGHTPDQVRETGDGG